MRNIAASVFDYACDNEVINKNPARGREIPKNAPKMVRRALTEKERKWVIEMPHRMRLAALTMMLTGLRVGELIPLTWQDFDFEFIGWNINKSVEKIKNVYVIKLGTKNKKSRFVEAPLELALEIEKAKKLQKASMFFASATVICILLHRLKALGAVIYANLIVLSEVIMAA